MRLDGQFSVKKFAALAWPCLIGAMCGCSTGKDIEKTKSRFSLGLGFSSGSSFDGKRLLTIQGEAACLWDVETGRQLHRFQLPTGFITAATLSPDGKQVLTAGARQIGVAITGGPIQLWDITTGRKIRRFEPQAGWVFDVQFSPDGRRILTALTATGSTLDAIQIWDVKTGRQLFVFPGLWQYPFGSPSVLSVNFSPDSRRLVELADGGGRVIVWDLAQGTEICAIKRIKRGDGFFSSVAFSPDGKLVLTASYESGLTWKEKITPDGKSIRVPSSGGAARTWDAKTGELVQEFSGHTNLVCQALFTSDGRRIITASLDGSARLWDAKKGKEIRRFQNTGPGPVEQMMLSRDGKRLITKWSLQGSDQATVRQGASLWDVESGREMAQLTNKLEEIVGFSPVDEKFMVIKEGKPVALWDGATGELIRQYDNLGAATSEER